MQSSMWLVVAFIVLYAVYIKAVIIVEYSYVIGIFFFNLKASLNHYKGFSSDDSCTQLEKMILVSLCSRIMNVSTKFIAADFIIMIDVCSWLAILHMVERNLLTTML